MEMDQRFEKLDTDNSLRPTIINPGERLCRVQVDVLQYLLLSCPSRLWDRQAWALCSPRAVIVDAHLGCISEVGWDLQVDKAVSEGVVGQSFYVPVVQSRAEDGKRGRGEGTKLGLTHQRFMRRKFVQKARMLCLRKDEVLSDWISRTCNFCPSQRRLAEALLSALFAYISQLRA